MPSTRMVTRARQPPSKGSTANSVSVSVSKPAPGKRSSSTQSSKSKKVVKSNPRSGSTPGAPASRVRVSSPPPSTGKRSGSKVTGRVGTKPSQLLAAKGQKSKGRAASLQRVMFSPYTGPALSKSGRPMGVAARGRGRGRPNGPGGDENGTDTGNDLSRSPSPARSLTPVPSPDSSAQNDWQDNVSFNVSQEEMDSLEVTPVNTTAELRAELEQKEADERRLQVKRDNQAKIRALKQQIAAKDHRIAVLRSGPSRTSAAAGSQAQLDQASPRQDDTPSWVARGDVELAEALLAQTPATPKPTAHSTPVEDTTSKKVKRKAPWHELPEAKRPKATINELSHSASDDSLGESSSSSDSDSSCSSRKKRKRKHKLKSGMFAKYSSKVVKPQKWPHNHLDPHFINPLPKFADLTWDQLVAGETAVILACSNFKQVLGRLKLLKQLAYWKIRTGDFPRVRQLYMGILNAIEQGESSWSSNFQLLEMLIMGDTARPIPRKLGEKPPPASKDKDKDHVFFCRKYQVGECTETLRDNAHKGWLGSTSRLLHHICATCLLKKRKREMHREKTSECPLFSS